MQEMAFVDRMLRRWLFGFHLLMDGCILCVFVLGFFVFLRIGGQVNISHRTELRLMICLRLECVCVRDIETAVEMPSGHLSIIVETISHSLIVPHNFSIFPWAIPRILRSGNLRPNLLKSFSPHIHAEPHNETDLRKIGGWRHLDTIRRTECLSEHSITFNWLGHECAMGSIGQDEKAQPSKATHSECRRN